LGAARFLAGYASAFLQPVRRIDDEAFRPVRPARTISGKMCVGVVTIAKAPSSTMTAPMTTKV
jgi:hypothetical protein